MKLNTSNSFHTNNDFIYLHTFQTEEVINILLDKHTYYSTKDKIYFNSNAEKYEHNRKFFNTHNHFNIPVNAVPIYCVHNLVDYRPQFGISNLPDKLYKLSEHFGIEPNRFMLELLVPTDVCLLFDPSLEDDLDGILEVWDSIHVGEFGIQALIPFIQPSYIKAIYNVSSIDNSPANWKFSLLYGDGIFADGFTTISRNGGAISNMVGINIKKAMDYQKYNINL